MHVRITSATGGTDIGRTGEGLVGTVWDDEAALQSASAARKEHRRRATERGVEFGEVTESEILYVSFH